MSEAAFVGTWVATNGQPSAAIADVLIVLYTRGIGMQPAAVRSLGVQGVLTTAGTFTLIALTSTFAGSRSKAEMPRLAGVLVGVVTGAWAEVCSSCARLRPPCHSRSLRVILMGWVLDNHRLLIGQ